MINKEHKQHMPSQIDKYTVSTTKEPQREREGGEREREREREREGR